MTLTVEVTQADIDNGKENDCFACPVALALARAAGRGVAEVDTAFATVNDVSTRLPDDVQVWIANFDCNGPDAVKPFTFTLEFA